VYPRTTLDTSFLCTVRHNYYRPRLPTTQYDLGSPDPSHFHSMQFCGAWEFVGFVHCTD
jgi:hypothetical protein